MQLANSNTLPHFRARYFERGNRRGRGRRVVGHVPREGHGNL